jgi:glucose/arabinose dehydrogenase
MMRGVRALHALRAPCVLLAITTFACGDGDETAGLAEGIGRGGGEGGSGAHQGGGMQLPDGGFVGPRPLPALRFEPIALPDAPEQATSFAFGPDDTLFVGRKSGVISRYVRDGDGYSKLGQFAVSEVWSYNDCGLESFALDPGFADNGLLFAAGCIGSTANRVWRLTVDASDDAATEASLVTILTVEEPAATRPFHNAGSLLFDEAGRLFALFGDKVLGANGQDLSDNLGAVLCLEPSRDADEGGYAPCAGNPFEMQADASADVYASGLRMPWRASLDGDGRLWVGDVGRNAYEELNLITEPGMNFGWSESEGPCEESCDGFVDPLVGYAHDDEHPYVLDDPDAAPTDARAIWVGPRYEASFDRYDGKLTGRVLFGDFCVGFVRALEIDADGAVVIEGHVGHLETPTEWRVGPDGFLYALSFGTCGSVVDDPPESVLYRAVLAD